jgi:Surface antigen
MIGRVGLACGLALAAVLVAAPEVAHARASVFVGVGPVMPVYPHYHYYPAPVYVAPPPPAVIYAPAPPPAVVFTQPQAPVAVDPAGPAYVARGGQLCREYQRTVMIGNVPQQVHGTACQQPDGSWRMMN